MTTIKKALLSIMLCLIPFSGQAFQNKRPEKHEKRKDKPILLEIPSPMTCGMFSLFTITIGMLKLYEDGQLAGCKVDFREGGLYYDVNVGPNWWEYYFMPVNVGNPKGAILRQASLDELMHAAIHAEHRTSKEQINYLIKKYIHVKSHVTDKVNAFKNENFSNAWMIGVHYRGTDKSSEAPRMPYETVVDAINEYVHQNPDKGPIRIFVATDEQAFIDYISTIFPNHVIYLQDATRSTDGSPIHFCSSENYKKGEDALLDCLLLSNCDVLIRTSSNLSLCSTYFNPNIPVIELNRRY